MQYVTLTRKNALHSKQCANRPQNYIWLGHPSQTQKKTKIWIVVLRKCHWHLLSLPKCPEFEAQKIAVALYKIFLQQMFASPVGHIYSFNHLRQRQDLPLNLFVVHSLNTTTHTLHSHIYPKWWTGKKRIGYQSPCFVSILKWNIS